MGDKDSSGKGTYVFLYPIVIKFCSQYRSRALARSLKLLLHECFQSRLPLAKSRDNILLKPYLDKVRRRRCSVRLYGYRNEREGKNGW